MKNRIYYFIIAFVSFFFLLYRQEPGINFLIYSLIMVGLSISFNSQISKPRITIAFALLISGLSVAIFGDPFSFILSVLLFLLLGFYQLNPKGKLFLSPFYIFCNYLLEITQIPKLFESVSNKKISNKPLRFYTLFVIPFAIIFVFTMIYREINYSFAGMLDAIEFPKLNSTVLILLGMSFIFNLGFWYFKNWFKEPNVDEQLHFNPQKDYNTQENSIELRSGMIVFGLLNLLLLLLLGFEFQEIYCNWNNSSPYELSNAVHLGVNAVEGSIILGVLLIVLYLYDKLNFVKANQNLKWIISIWIFLNFILLITSGLKNTIYINHSGLTLKRLGVFAFLFLTCIGLIFTHKKVHWNKSIFYLLQKMSWVFLIFSTLICPINWSKLITNFNITQAQKNNRTLDFNYLQRLDYNTIEIYNYLKKQPNEARHENEYSHWDEEPSITSKTYIHDKANKYRNLPFLSSTFYGKKVLRIADSDETKEK